MNQDRRRRILVGVHESAASLAALRWAAREASLRCTRLHVVHAWEDAATHAAPYGPHARLRGGRNDRAAAGARLARTVRAVLGPSPSIAAAAEVAEGLAARVLLDRAAGAELLVLGSAAPCGSDQIGPVSRACLRHAPCPVVMVSAEAVGADLLQYSR